MVASARNSCDSAALASIKNAVCDLGRMAIHWRTAYIISTFTPAVEESDFVPMRDLNRRNLEQDQAYAADHGMQTAFVKRPAELGGPVKPKTPEPGVSYMDAAEIHPEGDWTFVADDFLDLVTQISSTKIAGRIAASGHPDLAQE